MKRELLWILYGSPIKPLNLNSGERQYYLPPDVFWSNSKTQKFGDKYKWAIKVLVLLFTRIHQYDIVHFHTLSWVILLSPLILHLFNKKIVFTMSLFGTDNASYIAQQSFGRLKLALLRKFDGVIGLSPALVNDAIEHGFKNVLYLPNFLAISQLEHPITAKMKVDARAKIGISQDRFVLLFVGSIIRRKGVDVLMDVFIELSKKYSDICLIMVGPQSSKESGTVDDAYVSQQKEKIHNARLSDSVIWSGLIADQAMLVNYYRAADLFVFPTRNEGSPNVLAEAMAAGLPVIASLLPGTTDNIVLNGKNGSLVQVNSSEQFINAIELVYLDEYKRLKMGLASRKAALEKFSFDSYCQKLRSFYFSLFHARYK
jgi:glycosyltransferase involved in cell wall biosynthesis